MWSIQTNCILHGTMPLQLTHTRRTLRPSVYFVVSLCLSCATPLMGSYKSKQSGSLQLKVKQVYSSVFSKVMCASVLSGLRWTSSQLLMQRDDGKQGYILSTVLLFLFIKAFVQDE